MADFGHRVIAETFTSEASEYRGRLVSDIAEAEGKSALDALLDIVCSDELATTFCRPPSEPSRSDWIAMVAAWRGGDAVIGASDAGAHLDFTAYFDYPLYVLEKAVREHHALALEEAVRYLTDVPARLYGLRDRGRLNPGSYADIVIFDEATVATAPLTTRFDMPSGAGRLYAEPMAIEHVIVNGVPIVSNGTLTAARPGTLLRSGRDTSTPSLD
jgi:N-acyl-D-aspartate/D-glutamate deacylase